MRKTLNVIYLSLHLGMAVLLFGGMLTPGRAQGVTALPADVTGDDKDETPSTGLAQIAQLMPLTPAQAMAPQFWGSNMRYSWEHDARWGVGAASASTGATSRIASLLSKGNTFFLKTGDTFAKITQAYQDVLKMVELYNQMTAAWEFLKDYQLTVNLFRFLPLIDIMAPDEMGGGQAFAVGLLPKDSNGWEVRANLLNDNPWYRRPGGLRLIEVRYPHSLNELTLNASIWGTDDLDEEEFQKKLLSGMYDGIVSASLWMSNAGIANNLADNVAQMGPKALARRKSLLIAKRIQALQSRKDTLDKMSHGWIEMPVGMTPEDVMRQMALIDPEISRLEQMDETGYASAMMAEETWMRKASFAGEILAKLEQPQRRLAIMKLNERFRKYERFWADPDQMDPQPEITGNAQVDNCIYIIWQALTLLSKGNIPPPTPVPGGPAAESQSIMVRSMYREFLVDELRATRRLLAFRYVSDKQAEGADVVAEDGKKEIALLMTELDRHAARIAQLRAFAETRSIVAANGGAWALQMPVTAAE